jgi:2-oxoglutarate/2-oxoacid ferredoxin oxidoreductase subunit beta
VIVFKKLALKYDPTNRTEAIKMLEEAIRKNWLITGLIYVDPDSPNIYDMYPIGEKPLNRLSAEKIRPDRKSLDLLNKSLM